MEVTLEKHDAAAFRKLDYWQQWDAMYPLTFHIHNPITLLVQ